MRDKVRSFLKMHALLRRGDEVTVGLSGGADSVALLCVLCELRAPLGISVSACHVNHCLRGAESDADEAFCRALCARLGVALTVCRRDVPAYCAAHGCSVEEGARAVRYAALEEAAPGLIATAHHRNDNAETVLLNLARGTALDGLCGIPVRRGRIIRPLLGCTRAEIEGYLAAIGQDYRTDSTNETDLAARNRLRHAVVPVFEELNPAFVRTVFAMTETLSADRAYLDAAAGEWYETAVHGGILPRAPYLALADALRLRVLRRFLREAGASVDRDRLAAIDALMKAGRGTRPLARTLVFCADGEAGRIRALETPRELPDQAVDLDRLPQTISLFSGKTLEICLLSQQEKEFFVNIERNRYQNCLDCATIRRPLTVRARRAGDEIRLAGRGCTKAVRRLYAEAGIPAQARGGIAVAADADGPVWVEGFGAAERAAATPQSERILSLSITKKET